MLINSKQHLPAVLVLKHALGGEHHIGTIQVSTICTPKIKPKPPPSCHARLQHTSRHTSDGELHLSIFKARSMSMPGACPCIQARSMSVHNSEPKAPRTCDARSQHTSQHTSDDGELHLSILNCDARSQHTSQHTSDGELHLNILNCDARSQHTSQHTSD
eukprot:1161748-Pelagomonas_calceolata.AAC.11